MVGLLGALTQPGGYAAPVDGAAGTSQLERSQAARRQKVITAALELAVEGGYEAVQMRDVSTRSGVALGTIYRYFSSKDALLAGVLVEWGGWLEADVHARPPEGATVTERVADLLGRANTALTERPNLVHAVVKSMIVGGEDVAESQRRMSESLGRMVRTAFPAEVQPEVAGDVADVVAYIWFANLMSWASNWADADQLGPRLQRSLEIVLDQYG